MRRWAAVLVIVCAGCSNAPLAGFLDAVRPARFRPAIDEPFEPLVPQDRPPSGGALLPPQTVPPLPQPTPGGFVPSSVPDDRPSPGPLKLPNT